jgi:spore coat polysaccharide biosynthesis protein SpsF
LRASASCAPSHRLQWFDLGPPEALPRRGNCRFARRIGAVAGRSAPRASPTHRSNIFKLPFNLLDWRWQEAGIVAAIRARPTLTVHARSVFLQGVLSADDVSLWPGRRRLRSIPPLQSGSRIGSAPARRKDAADLCLAYVRAQDWIDGVVVGMETEAQLEANLSLTVRAPLNADQCAKIDASRPRVPEQLLDPAQWPRR